VLGHGDADREAAIQLVVNRRPPERCPPLAQWTGQPGPELEADLACGSKRSLRQLIQLPPSGRPSFPLLPAAAKLLQRHSLAPMPVLAP
jgi:hypothetical protein